MNEEKIFGPPINSGEIAKEIRELSVAWGDHYNDEIWNKFKLASDVQYVCIYLMKQFAKDFNIHESQVDHFFKVKVRDQNQ